MYTYILRRLLLMIPTLFGITIVVFVVMAAAPGGISTNTLVDSTNLEPEARQALEEYYNRRYGLDKPPYVQYLRWLNNISPVGFTLNSDGEVDGFSLLKGSDLGNSFRYGRSVMDLIGERLPITLLLNLLSIPLIYLVAISVGVYAATQRGKSFDVNSGVVLLGMWSVPTMLAGVLMIGIFASDQYWRWFPTAGINRRDALDMPFLPHWGSLLDVFVVFSCAVVGVLVLVALVRHAGKRTRAMILGGLGFLLGWLMGETFSSAETLFANIVLAILCSALFIAIARSEFQALRVATMGFVGLLLGVGIAGAISEGVFQRGFLLDRLWHLALPIICLSYGGFAYLAKLSRSAVLENLLSDYARTARAKGVSEKDVLWRHVFRNSLLPLITVSATLLPALLGGSVIVESIFSIDGMGKLAVEAVQGRDRELVLSVTLISGLLTLAGYLIADICYAIADPRISYD